MIEVRLQDPPDEPPPQVTSELLWRVAERLYRDHASDPAAPQRCARCPHPWPCSGRRLAELALTVATA